MHRSDILAFLLIFGIQFGIAIWAMVRYFKSVGGRNLKIKTGASGQNYFFSQQQYGKYKGRSLVSAGVMVQNGFVFSIWRRNFWHRLLTPLGLAQDIRTGDPLLDDTFYFMADDSGRLGALIASSGFVTVLRDVFQSHKVKDIEGRLNKVWFNAGPLNDTEINEEGYAGQAARLAAEVEKIAPGYTPNTASLPLSQAAFLYRIAHIMLLVLGAVMAATMLFRSEDIINKKDFFIEAAAIAPVVIALWLAQLMVIFGKTSWFPQVSGSFALSGIIGLALLTGFLTREANIDLDMSPPQVKSLPLEAKSCSLYCTTSGKNAHSSHYALSDQQCSLAQANDTIAYYRQQDYRCHSSARINYNLYFPWPTERTDGSTDKYKLSATAANYEYAHEGENFLFPIHKGTLGLAWIRKADVRAE